MVTLLQLLHYLFNTELFSLLSLQSVLCFFLLWLPPKSDLFVLINNCINLCSYTVVILNYGAP